MAAVLWLPGLTRQGCWETVGFRTHRGKAGPCGDGEAATVEDVRGTQRKNSNRNSPPGWTYRLLCLLCVGAAYRFSANKSKIPPGNSAIFETTVPVAINLYSQVSPLRGNTCIVVPAPSIPSYIMRYALFILISSASSLIRTS